MPARNAVVGGTTNQMMQEGVFVVIDGPNINQTIEQTQLLKDKLSKNKFDVLVLNFPLIDQDSSYFVRRFVQNEYEANSAQNPYVSSLFFMLDRYDNVDKINDFLQSGGIVLASQFIASTMVQQGLKLATPEQSRALYLWLDNYEHQTLNIPRPNKSFVIIPPLTYVEKLQKSISAYKDLCQLFPKDYERIDTEREDTIFDTQRLHNYIWERVKPLLPSRKIKKRETSVKTKPTYIIPDTLDDKTKIMFKTYIDTLLDCYLVINQKLSIQNAKIAEQILPIATLNQPINKTDKKTIPKLTQTKLSKNFSESENESVKLVKCVPRNELDLVPEILYETTALSLDNIRLETDKWTYKRKEKLLSSYLKNNINLDVLNKVTYEWDIFAPYIVLNELQEFGFDIKHQQLTPRYGYETPKAIEDNDLSDIWDLCFDLSLELTSKLQSAGYDFESQYGTLLGHKTRFSLLCNGEILKIIDKVKKSPVISIQTKEVASKINDIIHETHPLLDLNA